MAIGVLRALTLAIGLVTTFLVRHATIGLAAAATVVVGGVEPQASLLELPRQAAATGTAERRRLVAWQSFPSDSTCPCAYNSQSWPSVPDPYY